MVIVRISKLVYTYENIRPINCLVLALQGEDDEYGTGEQLQRIEEGIGSGVTKVCIPNCAHIPHNQARESVMEHTTKFIRDLIKPTSIK